MEELVQAINALQGSPMDDLIVLVPSVVAIVISICTARKQNQIALFEKRYEVYAEVERIRNVGRKLEGKVTKARTADMLTGVVVTMGWEKGSAEVIHAQRIRTESLLHQAQFLYPRFPVESLQNLMTCFEQYLKVILGQGDDPEAIHAFVRACGAQGDAERVAEAMQGYLKLGGRQNGASFRR